MNVRYSESDNSVRDPKYGYSEDERAEAKKSGAENSKERRQLTEKEKQLIRNPKPGPSGIRKTGTHAANKTKEEKYKQITKEAENKAQEQRGKVKNHSPIKYPKNTPVKNNEEVPLSKLAPRKITPPRILDLRNRLDAAPESSGHKIDSGVPLASRINFDPPLTQPWLAWLPGNTPKNNPWLPPTSSHMKSGTAHRNRPFFEGNPIPGTKQNRRERVQENEELSEEDDVTGDEFVDPKKKKRVRDITSPKN